MADLTPPAGTAPAPITEAGSPAPGVVAPSNLAPETGAGTISDEFLAGIGLSPTKAANPKGNTEPAPSPEAAAKKATEATPGEGEQPDPEDAEVEAKIKDKETPKWVSDRLSKNAKQKQELKQQLEAITAEKQAAEKRAEDLAAQLPTLQPSSPLAHLDTVEKLEAESEAVREFLDKVDDPQLPSAHKDYDPDTGISETFESNKSYAKLFLKNEKTHAAVLKARAETTEAVRKAAPALFDGKSEDFKFRAQLHQRDPRTLPDFEQIIADAARGRRERLEEAEGKAKYTRQDLAAAKAAGTKGAETKAAAKAQDPVPVFTPSALRAAVTPSEAPNAREAVLAKSRSKTGASLEEMMDAGVLR